jgi:2-isopropylmalate synthase
VTHEDEHYKLLSMRQSSETGERPSARIVLSVGGVEHDSSSNGNGPVDATMKAIEAKVSSGAELMLYSVNAITTGTEAQGEVTVRLSKGGRIVNGIGADPDIVVASAKAYLNALNKLHSGLPRVNPQIDSTI